MDETQQLTLRPMTQTEYDVYIEFTIEDYAEERAKNFGTTMEEERENSRQQITELLEDGLETENHHIWSLALADDAKVGHMWVFVDPERHRAFIYDVAVDAERRGKGYGKRMLELMDEKLKGMGVTSVGLNVFSTNDTARRLYERHGFHITNYNMQKEL